MEAIIIFTLSFLGINFLVFLPNLLIGLFSKIEHPKKSFFKDTPYFILKKILYIRYSDDCFRLIFEIQVLTFFLLLFNGTYLHYFKILLIGFVILSFIYITYITVIIKVFKKAPILINDINFARTGFMIYEKKIPLFLLSVVLVIVAVFLLSNSIIEILIESSLQIEQKWPILLLLFLSILLSVFSIKKVRYNLYYSCVSFSLIKHFAHNLKKCEKLKKSLKTLNQNFPYEYMKKIQLKKQPNVILIFLESYGSFTLSNDKYSGDIKKKMVKINESLTARKWKAVSTLSESPVSSGGSWLSHSSILFGAKVRDTAAHEIIFSHTEYVSKLASIPKYLSAAGYKTIMTSTLSYDKNQVDWKKVKNAYPFDDMMLFNDFNYTGEKVPIFGDRFTLPDQYTLNYAYDSLSDKSPFFLSVSTVNSHYNYISPIKPLKHWKDYNTESFPLTDGLKKNNLKNYFLAMHYQFDYIHDFFLNNDPDDTIAILIGDHQPPFITPANIDKATPIHVISNFKEFNFTEGLIPTNQTQKHESFFSKLLYALNRAYGENKNLELPIFEDGINLY